MMNDANKMMSMWLLINSLGRWRWSWRRRGRDIGWVELECRSWKGDVGDALVA